MAIRKKLGAMVNVPGTFDEAIGACSRAGINWAAGRPVSGMLCRHCVIQAGRTCNACTNGHQRSSTIKH